MKEKEIDKDTVIAYHDFVQHQIRGELNGIFLGPGRFYAQIAVASFLAGVISAIVGILVITLRTRHVYLISWDDQFLGPFFVILAFMLAGFAAALVVQAKRRANAYRRDLVFRPIGDYGVAVCHKSRLVFEQTTREQLKSGTAPKKPTKAKPYQPISYTSDGRPRRGPRPGGFDNRGYGEPPPYDGRRGPPDGRRPPPDRRGPSGRPRNGPPDDRRRYGPPPPGEDGRPPPYGFREPGSRRPPPDDRYRDGPPRERRGPPPNDRYRGGPPPGDRYRDGPPPGDRYRDAPPPSDRYRDGPPPDDRYAEMDRNRRRPPDDRNMPKTKLEDMHEGDESSF
ncbi:cleavage and polyadenylation specificity factor subunit 6-like [Saccostrea cucullata]|uniref:cleavage and polyadenylation specificity factor subunit 6-like n=1 Tax=Saccostrea cuccullata TaxID=36930 RepID=UPI002ED6AD42